MSYEKKKTQKTGNVEEHGNFYWEQQKIRKNLGINSLMVSDRPLFLSFFFVCKKGVAGCYIILLQFCPFPGKEEIVWKSSLPLSIAFKYSHSQMKVDQKKISIQTLFFFLTDAALTQNPLMFFIMNISIVSWISSTKKKKKSRYIYIVLAFFCAMDCRVRYTTSLPCFASFCTF